MPLLFIDSLDDPFEPFDDVLRPLPFAVLTFWYSGTTTPAPVYSDVALTDQINDEATGELVADSAGIFPTIYLDPAILYRSRLETAERYMRFDVDPYEIDTSISGRNLYRSPVVRAVLAGRIVSTATMTFTDNVTGDPKNTYADAELTVPHPNPIAANAAGIFPPIYIEGGVYFVLPSWLSGFAYPTTTPGNEVNFLTSIDGDDLVSSGDSFTTSFAVSVDTAGDDRVACGAVLIGNFGSGSPFGTGWYVKVNGVAAAVVGSLYQLSEFHAAAIVFSCALDDAAVEDTVIIEVKLVPLGGSITFLSIDVHADLFGNALTSDADMLHRYSQVESIDEPPVDQTIAVSSIETGAALFTMAATTDSPAIDPMLISSPTFENEETTHTDGQRCMGSDWSTELTGNQNIVWDKGSATGFFGAAFVVRPAP